MSDFATPDIIMLIVILLSALIGLARGLIKEVLSLASWALAFILALYFAPLVGNWLSADLANARLVIGFAVVFVAVLIIGAIVQWLVSKLVESTGLTGTDRFLGFLFGSARGVLVCIVALIALRPFAEDTDWWHASSIRPELAAFEEDVVQLMDHARDVVSNVGGSLL